ncbi:LexA-binding, inner membrane-associated putative hydrolase [Micromonospora pisi]|uniref:LexA-binding, inner membrane-associated putative hydrolase n=1 Tax=Micromonospora pisi TaxID=589240 RepID=A0A495JVX9_9ACTN|nr:metal-dependent hydrolase [Micromonospora pisi]RKR92738.1 LexA-binding, inner membrane-associated putative hydrolase [Micromonospora pisi]
MLGRTHALSGATGWVAGCAAATAVGAAPSMQVMVVGGLVSAGMAIFPDIDHPQSTIARTLGPVTGLVARGIAAGASRLRSASCDHCATGRRKGGHRQLTHTALFALALGGLVSLAGWLAGARVGLVVVWVAVGLAARVLLSRRQRGTLGAVLIASVVTAAVAVTTEMPWWWLGGPVAWGTFAHSLGDAATKYGAPLWWPARIRGCRWARVGMWEPLRFTTGDTVERVVWWFLLFSSIGGTSYVLTGS